MAPRRKANKKKATPPALPKVKVEGMVNTETDEEESVEHEDVIVKQTKEKEEPPPLEEIPIFRTDPTEIQKPVLQRNLSELTHGKHDVRKQEEEDKVEEEESKEEEEEIIVSTPQSSHVQDEGSEVDQSEKPSAPPTRVLQLDYLLSKRLLHFIVSATRLGISQVDLEFGQALGGAIKTYLSQIGVNHE